MFLISCFILRVSASVLPGPEQPELGIFCGVLDRLGHRASCRALMVSPGKGGQESALVGPRNLSPEMILILKKFYNIDNPLSLKIFTAEKSEWSYGINEGQ